METKEKKKGDDLANNVKIKLVDPLGMCIPGLQYLIKHGSTIVARGATDDSGAMKQFASKIGAALEVYVQRFGSEEMKLIRTLTPWRENYSVKLSSSKIKETMKAAEDKGAPGDYRRKTHKVKEGDTLGKIAAKNKTTVQAIAELNKMKVTDILHIDRVLKLPPETHTGGASPSNSSGATAHGSSSPSAPAANSAPAAAERSSLEPHPAPPSSTARAPAPTAPAPASAQPAPAAPQPPATPAPAAPAAAQSAPTATQAKPPAPTTVPIKVENGRGENGTPKTSASISCDQSGCIKVGDSGRLVEEINIRLLGFGDILKSGKPWNQFTAETSQAVKNFQRDYMDVPATGVVCGAVLKALDQFREKFTVDLASMKCDCGHCNGWGHGYKNSSGVNWYKSKDHPHLGAERPGMHRGLLWVLRAVKFFVDVKDGDKGYRYLKIASGYRCWFNNKQHERTSINHMGSALDIHFKKVGENTRCGNSGIEIVRNDIIVKRMPAQIGWKINRLCLEPKKFANGKAGATTWVHIDVARFEATWTADKYFVNTQEGANDTPLMEIARLESRNKLINCGGIPVSAPAPAVADTGRVPVNSLSLSKAGLDFIKAYEELRLAPYEDARHFCTIGYGHLIAEKKCSALAKDKDAEYLLYAKGIDEKKAKQILEQDLEDTINLVKLAVKVPLHQHEFDALVSLAFNCGGIRKFPKLMSNLNSKDYNGCCNEFSDITNNGIPGLVKRRNAEMKMFRNKVYDSTH